MPPDLSCNIEWKNFVGNDLLDLDCSSTFPGVLAKDTCQKQCGECIFPGMPKVLILKFVIWQRLFLKDLYAIYYLISIKRYNKFL